MSKGGAAAHKVAVATSKDDAARSKTVGAVGRMSRPSQDGHEAPLRNDVDPGRHPGKEHVHLSHGAHG